MEKYFKDLFKKYLKKFHVAFSPNCCEDALEPVGFNQGIGVYGGLQYYDSETNTYIDVELGGIPANPNRSVQFNNNGVFGGYDGFIFDVYNTLLHGIGVINGNPNGVHDAHVEGLGTSIYADYAHAEGIVTSARGVGSHSEGNFSQAWGIYSHAEGISTQAIGQYCHAEGYNANANGIGSHAEGFFTYTNGPGAHAEGLFTQALGSYSHAEGQGSSATGDVSHAEGYQTLAVGAYSHAQGWQTQSLGAYSSSFGFETYTNNFSQMAVGRWNSIDTDSLFVVGNGTDAGGGRGNKFEVTNIRIFLYDLPNYADNAAALGGGLSPEEVYRSGDFIKIVH